MQPRLHCFLEEHVAPRLDMDVDFQTELIPTMVHLQLYNVQVRIMAEYALDDGPTLFEDPA